MQKRRTGSEKTSGGIRRETDSQTKPVKRESRRSRKRGRHKISPARWALLFIMAISSAAAMRACVLTYGFPAPIQARLDIRPDQHARQGTLHAKESREVEDGDFWVVINQLPTMKAGTRECSIQYENPSGNHYSARISLYLKETGKLLGNTTRVDPGYYVESIRLKQSLKAGEYPVTARIELFDGQTPAGEMSIGMTLRIIENQDSGTAEHETEELKTEELKTEGTQGGETG